MSTSRPSLNPERWRRIETAVAAAFELDPADRAGFLAERFADAPELLEEALALVSSSEGAEGYLDELAGRVTADDGDTSFRGKRVGAYRLTERLGRGGMGAVYLAARDDRQFEMQVAVKLLPIGLASGSMRRRFLAERKILARLEHPGIARLLDGGFLDDGTPYFVMEYVQGKPIDVYCDANRLGVRERLELVERICEAVGYAHRNLVVHRDLKPGNILVTQDGRVKLLDFGIAKVLDAESTGEPTALTRLGGRPLTPTYASPEQIRGEAIATATDVYSLGVLLYRLLTGRLPYEIDPAHTRAELERIVCEEAVPAPSRRLAPPVPPGTGGLDHLRRVLRGDLDTIVGKALRKEPDRRYSTVGELAEDLRRHRQGWPVLARGDSWAYRTRRFLRRRRTSVAAAAAVVLVAAGYVATLQGYATRLEAERDRAHHEAAKSARVSDLLTELFRGADPTVHHGDPVTVRELLDRGAARIEEELAEAPELKAEMLERLGWTYVHLDQYGDALRLLTVADSLYATLSPTAAPADLDRQRTIAYLHMQHGDFERSDSLFRALGVRVRRMHGEESVPYAVLRYHQGLLHRQRGEMDRSDDAYLEAVRIFEAIDSVRHPSYATAATNLARSLARRARYEEAEERARTALDLRAEVLGTDHPETVQARSVLADVLRQKGDFAGAERLLSDLMDVGSRLWGPASARVAGFRHELALTLTELARFEEAEPLYHAALEVEGETAYGATIRTHLALLLERTGRLAEAADAHGRAIDTWTETLGEDHQFVTIGVFNLAGVRHRQGRFEEAEPLFRRALDHQRSILGDDHPQIGWMLVRFGAFLRDAGKLDEAGRVLERGAAIVRAGFPPRHVRAVEVLEAVGGLASARGEHARAEALLGEAVEIRREIHGEDDPRLAYARVRLGLALAAAGSEGEAARLLRTALPVLSRSFGARNWLTRRAAVALERAEGPAVATAPSP